MRSLLPTAAVGLLAAAATLAAASPAAADPTPTTSPAPGYYHPVAPVRALDTRTQDTPLRTGGVLQLDLTPYVPSGTASAVVLNLTATSPTASTFLTAYPDGVTRPTASNLNVRSGETRSNSATVALPADGSRVVDIYNLVGSTQVIVDVEGYYDITTSSDVAYFRAATPTRLLDTRSSAPGRQGNGGRIDLAVPLAVPAVGVTAVAVTITAVDPSGQGFLTAWDGQDDEPTTSTVNYGTDPATPNFAVVPAVEDENGVAHFSIGVHAAATDVVVDLVGRYAPYAATGSLYIPATPTRTGDTRESGGPLGQGTSRTFGTGTGPTAFPVDGVNLNLTAVDATVPTYLTAYDPDAARPAVSTLNVLGATARAGATQVGTSPTAGDATANTLDVYNLAGSVDVVTDVEGYFVLLPA